MKSKYNPQTHADIIQKIYEQMPIDTDDKKKVKIDVIIQLISTKFQASKTATFVSREEWMESYNLVSELLTLV